MPLDNLSSNCPICNKIRIYKTKLGHKNGLNKPCKSCSNSICRGGTGAKYSKEGVKCSNCKKYYPLENFYIKKSTNAPYSRCKSCHVSISSEYYQLVDKFNRYGITKEKFELLLKQQNGKCAGCEITMSNPYIDHCHKTGKVRGLLCMHCNSALGHIKDNEKTLKNLIKYLREKSE